MMRNLFMLVGIVLLLSACTAKEPSFDPMVAASETGVDVTALPDISTPTSSDDGIVTYEYLASEGDRITELKFSGDEKDFLNGDGNWINRETSKLDLTVDTVLTEAQILANKYITNQGDAGEADLTLPAVSYAIAVIFLVEEVQNVEINPPSGEAFDLNGAVLDADDCVDSDSTVGSKIVATRMQNASATWHWSLDTARGTWVDTGASD